MKSGFLVYPNPSDEGEITIVYKLENEALISCSVTDVAGRIIATPFSRQKKQKGKHSFELNTNLSAGIYFVLMDVSGRMYCTKIIKN